MLTLPTVSRSRLGLRPIDWTGLPKRFMNESELETLIALVASVRPSAVLEFGVNTGRTAKAILANVPGIRSYQGIDVTRGYVTAKAVQRNEVPDRPGELVEGDSRFHLVLSPRGSLDLTAAELQPCDAAFIDGDHGREAVMHDTRLARQLVRPGGIIIWHDYHDLGNVDVRECLHEMAEAGQPIIHVHGTWIAYQRVPA
jgi:predicted O-methyltransferase YrrM